jgi:hypothetical protein
MARMVGTARIGKVEKVEAGKSVDAVIDEQQSAGTVCIGAQQACQTNNVVM